jgi:YHS domain-containing protein
MKIFISAMLMVLFAVPALAQKPEIFTTKEGAIRGYDAVAYFQSGKPVKGETQWMYEWKTQKWLFSSRENLERFKSNPEKYAPQYGGWCAYGMARGYKAKTEPEAWSIVNGKLYLNYDLGVRDDWNKKQSEYIKTADENWKSVKSK